MKIIGIVYICVVIALVVRYGYGKQRADSICRSMGYERGEPNLWSSDVTCVNSKKIKRVI
jgi:hypothetical protein